MAPVSGLLAHALERHEPRPGLAMARVAYEILGLIPLAPTEVRVRTLRPGRTIELLEAIASVGGRDVVRAQAWRLAGQETGAVAGGLPRAMPPRQGCAPLAASATWAGGFIDSIEVLRGAGPGAGRGAGLGPHPAPAPRGRARLAARRLPRPGRHRQRDERAARPAGLGLPQRRPDSVHLHRLAGGRAGALDRPRHPGHHRRGRRRAHLDHAPRRARPGGARGADPDGAADGCGAGRPELCRRPARRYAPDRSRRCAGTSPCSPPSSSCSPRRSAGWWSGRPSGPGSATSASWSARRRPSAAFALEQQVSRALSATYTLSALVQNDEAVANFDRLAAQLLPIYGGVSSLQLAPGGVVGRIYPLAGNEAAIGHDLLADPDRRFQAMEAVTSRRLTVAGPFELRQGGIGLVGRLAVYLPAPGRAGRRAVLGAGDGAGRGCRRSSRRRRSGGSTRPATAGSSTAPRPGEAGADCFAGCDRAARRSGGRVPGGRAERRLDALGGAAGRVAAPRLARPGLARGGGGGAGAWRPWAGRCSGSPSGSSGRWRCAPTSWRRPTPRWPARWPSGAAPSRRCGPARRCSGSSSAPAPSRSA